MMAFDKVKESAKRGLASGRARMEQTRALRQRTKLLQELGEVCYSEHTGQATHEAVVGKLRILDYYEETLRERPSGRPEPEPEPERQARDIMHPGCECIGEDESVATAAQKMRDLGVGSLPICGTADRLHGIITDRDITINCIAEGKDAGQVRVRDLVPDTVVWVDADTDADEVLHRMEDKQVKRLPVFENDRLVGIISEADLARNLDEHRLAEFLEKVYATS